MLDTSSGFTTMIKRILTILLFLLVYMWMYDTLLRRVPDLCPAPGRLAEAFILTGKLLILLGSLLLMRLIWRRFRFHLPDSDARRWEKRNSICLTEHKVSAPQDEGTGKIYHNFFTVFLILVIICSAKMTGSSPQLTFNRFVTAEHYLSADIMHFVFGKKIDSSRTLLGVVTNQDSEQVKARKVEYLLSKGANPHYPGHQYTPLRTAVESEHNRHLIPLMLKYHPDAARLAECSLLRNPVRDGDEACIQLLLRHGAEVNFPDDNGRTPLYHAVDPSHGDEQKALRIARFLLQAGANVNAVKLSHRPPFAATPLDQAERCQFPAMGELLRSHGGKRAREIEAEYYHTQESK